MSATHTPKEPSKAGLKYNLEWFEAKMADADREEKEKRQTRLKGAKKARYLKRKAKFARLNAKRAERKKREAEMKKVNKEWKAKREAYIEELVLMATTKREADNPKESSWRKPGSCNLETRKDVFSKYYQDESKLAPL